MKDEILIFNFWYQTLRSGSAEAFGDSPVAAGGGWALSVSVAGRNASCAGCSGSAGIPLKTTDQYEL